MIEIEDSIKRREGSSWRQRDMEERRNTQRDKGGERGGDKGNMERE